MDTIVTVVHFITAFLIIVLILLQQGKGAEMGASFGGGGSNTVFGSTGGGSFFGKLTSILAVVFFCTSLGLALFARNEASLNLSDQIPFLENSGLEIPETDIVESVEIVEPVMPTDELEFDEISVPEGSDLGSDDVESPTLEMPAE